MSTTLSELKIALCGTDGSQGVLQDSSYYSAITTWINHAVTAIAAGIRMPNGEVSPPLPDLIDTDTVNTATDAAYKSLPDDYQRNVFMVSDENGNQIIPPRGGDYKSFALFMRQVDLKDLSESGDVYIAVTKGSRLYYQGIPSEAKALTVHFYRIPTDMSEDDDTVDGLPDHLAKHLIKHWVCKEIFGEGLEDSDRSRQAGVKYHTAKFFEVMTDLIDFVGIDAAPEYYGTDDEDYDW